MISGFSTYNTHTHTPLVFNPFPVKEFVLLVQFPEEQPLRDTKLTRIVHFEAEKNLKQECQSNILLSSTKKREVD